MGIGKRTRACDISQKVRDYVHERDSTCIFCKAKLHMELAAGNNQVMHYVPRSQGGLGIPENLALGCVGHHTELDNGGKFSAELQQYFEFYLKLHHPGWRKERLVYNKWSFLQEDEGGEEDGQIARCEARTGFAFIDERERI